MEPRAGETSTSTIVAQQIIAEATVNGVRYTVKLAGGDLPFEISKSHEFSFGGGEVVGRLANEVDAVALFSILITR
jgi:hypothetical protein